MSSFDLAGRSPLRLRLRILIWGIAAGVTLVALSVGIWKVTTRSRPTVAGNTRDVPRIEGGAVVFSSAFLARAGVAFAKAELAPFNPTVQVVGTVAFNPSHVAAVGTRLRGTVRRTFKYEGDLIKAGEPLGEVESAELGEAQATMTQSEARLEAAERNAQRELKLLADRLTTAREAELAETELANQRSDLRAARQRVQSLGGAGSFGIMILRSPIGGRVVERNVSPGQSVDSTTIAYRVADLDHLWIELSVFERNLPFVHVDDDVGVNLLAEPHETIQGKVAHVGEVIDATTRSAAVRVTVDYPKIHLRPGQSVRASITSRAVRPNALLIPRGAVVYFDGTPTVFVVEGEGRVRPTPVKLGASDGARYQIVEGVRAGQLVASEGVFALKSELFR